jgi:DNA-binding NarL/FixJ family response regulator
VQIAARVKPEIESSVTVVIGAFEPLIGRGLSATLTDDRRLSVIAADLDGNQLVHAVTGRASCVAVMDEAAAYSLLPRLAEHGGRTGVVVLAHHPTVTYGRLLLALGATCVARDVLPEKIADAVFASGQGERIFMAGDGLDLNAKDVPLLTRRELQVLTYVSEGKPYAVIGLELGISVETVRKHVAKARRTIGVRTRHELAEMRVPLGKR